MFQRVRVGWFRPRDPQAVQGQVAGGFSMGARPRLWGAGWEGQVGGGWCDLIVGRMHHPWTVSG